MKILILNSIGSKKWGGGEKWVLMASQSLQDLGHDVQIGCLRGSKLQKRALQVGLSVASFHIFTDFSFLGMVQLRRYFSKNGTDVVIACQNKDVRNCGWTRLMYSGKFPLIVARQGVERIYRGWKYRFTFTRLCDGIVTNSQSLKKLYDRFGWWNDKYVKVITNGIEVRDISQIVPFDFRKEFGLNAMDEAIFVFTSCRLAKQKRVDLLIEAAHDLVDGGYPFYFVVAGTGREYSLLKRRIEELALTRHFRLVGFKDSVDPYLKGADVFALTSAFEGMSNSLLEAMYFGLPVVSSAVNGSIELIDAQSGLLFESGSKEDLCNQLLRMNDSGLRKQLGEAAQKRVMGAFPSDIMARNYELYLKELIRNHL